MRRHLAIATVAASLLVPAAFAQRGSGSHAGGGFRGGAGFHGAPGGMGIRGGPGIRGFAPGARGIAPRGGFTRFGGTGFGRGFDGDFDRDDFFRFRHHHHRFFFTAGFGYAYYPYAYAYPAYPAYADYSPRNYDAYADVSSASAVNDAYEQGALRQQVSDLENEVQQMRSEVAQQRQTPSAPARPLTAAEAPPVTLVFRDGHRADVSNYAIAGNTFWIVNERSARKIAMSEIDVVATKRVNEQNGVELDWLR
ncbi:MAG TPA: hypothetical protein VGR50_07695 [Terriglobales bacterium]|nr:hypothetical protein [Terriglobales bacterium]